MRPVFRANERAPSERVGVLPAGAKGVAAAVSSAGAEPRRRSATGIRHSPAGVPASASSGQISAGGEHGPAVSTDDSAVAEGHAAAASNDSAEARRLSAVGSGDSAAGRDGSAAEWPLAAAESSLPAAELSLPTAGCDLPTAEAALPLAEQFVAVAECSLPIAESAVSPAESMRAPAETRPLAADLAFAVPEALFVSRTCPRQSWFNGQTRPMVRESRRIKQKPDRTSRKDSPWKSQLTQRRREAKAQGAGDNQEKAGLGAIGARPRCGGLDGRIPGPWIP